MTEDINFAILRQINDLPNCAKSKARLFVGDCLLFTLIKTLQDQIQLQEDLKALAYGANKWRMGINASKINIMSNHRTWIPLTYHYSLNNHILEQILLDFSLTVKAATLIFISECCLAISSAKEGKSSFIYNLVKSK